ncbi:uncharacterized protein LOC9635144 [Selaginella moellendorffii]|uniref:uncharacterized protein LOC9635144 n=1 Tax=Selaginella moellendorffii TaxID=88036 RepID=UPI000D1CB158|nr:uncharacterized protein LOC9635144 [Selaginella moellendorffii]|eukprot:XP_024540239.1 uncharacterized protein LOC9635144 [Selaginella moellendorffii]
MEEAANAALKKLDGRYVSPTTLKGMISEAHPTPPMEVVAHHLQQVSTQPPLNEICMLDDFAIEDWPSFRNDKIQWFASLQDAPFPPKVRSPLYIKFRPYLFHATKRIYESKVWRQQQQRDPLELNFHYGSGEGSCVGSPDMVITDSSNDETLVVGVMAMDPTGRPALARLYSYLLLTDCSFGVVSSYMRTACCKRVGSRLLVSQGVSHVESPMMGIGFMLAEALQNKKHKPALPLRSLHLSYARGVFEECCRAQQVRSVGQMVSGLGALDIGDVRELRFACSGFEGLTIVVRGLYKGRTIVVKAKDLSALQSNGESMSYLLGKSVRELDVYMRLHRVQGICIPRLLSYGFIRGGMIFYVIMSDEGQAAGVEDWTPSNAEEVRAVVSQARKALLALHDRGVVYNGLHDLKNIVVTVEGGQPRAKLVGFGNAIVGRDRRTCRAMDEDLMQLKECEEFLQEICATFGGRRRRERKRRIRRVSVSDSDSD